MEACGVSRRAAARRQKGPVGDVRRREAGQEAVGAHCPSAGAWTGQLCGADKVRQGATWRKPGSARTGRVPLQLPFFSPETTLLSPLKPGSSGVIGCRIPPQNACPQCVKIGHTPGEGQGSPVLPWNPGVGGLPCSPGHPPPTAALRRRHTQTAPHG